MLDNLADLDYLGGMDNDEFTVTQAAERLQVSRATIWNWINAEKLATRRTIGLRGDRLIPLSEIERIEKAGTP